jgi:hypothetical protein
VGNTSGAFDHSRPLHMARFGDELQWSIFDEFSRTVVDALRHFGGNCLTDSPAFSDRVFPSVRSRLIPFDRLDETMSVMLIARDDVEVIKSFACEC